MAYLFLDDGGPEAQEYESNYFYFNGADSRTVSQIHSVLRGTDPSDPKVRTEITSICLASLQKKQKSKVNKKSRTTCKEWVVQRFEFCIQTSKRYIFRVNQKLNGPPHSGLPKASANQNV
ncbi:MAG: hypothetical protein PHZ02_12110 [Desulfocapsaceae bacterium]|nr:hypothetical protein [Desulfocapsaceae bacterium]